MSEIIRFIPELPRWAWALFFFALVAVYDIFFNRKHTILHNFPIAGRARYFLENFGPPLLQYIVANNYHKMGAYVVFQVGTGYFGVRNPDASFSMEKMVELTRTNTQVRTIEVKLSQGAKPEKGGVLREAMFSVGCIQTQSCHTNKCPTGVATQSKCLQAGINVKNKAERVNYYFTRFKKELLEMTHAFGYEPPCQFNMRDVEINLGDRFIAKSLADTFYYEKTKVPFDSVATLAGCPNLGGSYRKAQETEVKEVDTEKTAISDQ